MDMDSLRPWLALHRAPGIGAQTFYHLIEQCPDPAQLLQAGHGIWRDYGLSEKQCRSLARPDWDGVDRDCLWLEQPHHHVIRFCDDAYPALLQQIHSPPPLLFVNGDPSLLKKPQLAMVGSRNPTVDGTQNAQDFAAALASQGLVITSGLALGIDGASHRGALASGGKTLAIVGTGPDRIYPARHRPLGQQIAECGAIISEFPVGVGVKAHHFPRRNRLISGLSLGTLVVEAARQSGSLITAQFALEQGREVFAMPGSIHNPLARGCHHLLRQGAKLVETTEDILIELGQLPGLQEPAAAAASGPIDTATPGAALAPEAEKLLQCMAFDPLPVDCLIQRSGLTADTVSSMLLFLELRGDVNAGPGGVYSRRR